MNTTKTPTTYNKVLPGDMIDGEVVIAKRRDGNGLVALQFASLDWGPWQTTGTPVSVWR